MRGGGEKPKAGAVTDTPPDRETSVNLSPQIPSKPDNGSDASNTERRPEEPVHDENGTLPAVLMYHLIMETPNSNLENLFVRPEVFSAQLDALNSAGYGYLFANDYGRTEKPSVILTFDDGYEDNYTTMFPILKEHGAKATIFLISDWINGPGYLNESQIKEMAESGLVFFGSHTANHTDLTTLSSENVRAQFSRSVAAIERLTGRKCDVLAYPAGATNDVVCSIAEEYFRYAYLARPTTPEGGVTDMKIPRVYVGRGMSAESLLNTIR